jgi:hypothetical protein
MPRWWIIVQEERSLCAMPAVPWTAEKQARAIRVQHLAQALVERLDTLPDPTAGLWDACVYTPTGTVLPEWQELLATLHPNLAALDRKQARLQAALTHALAPAQYTLLLELNDAWTHWAPAQADAAFVLGMAEMHDRTAEHLVYLDRLATEEQERG